MRRSRRRISLGIWSLVGVVGLLPVREGNAKPPRRVKPIADEEPAKCTDREFLGQRLARESFTSVLEWQAAPDGKGRWHDPQITTPIAASASLILLHFWGHFCEPCKKDFPIYAALSRAWPKLLYKRYNGRAQGIRIPFLYLAEDTPSESMERFLADNAKLLDGGINYQDAGGQIRRQLERQIGCRIGLPLTLVVDRDLRVQSAFVGSIDSRRDDLLEALLRGALPGPGEGFKQAAAKGVGGPL